MICRICHHDGPLPFRNYRPYLDYEVAVYDCPRCGCRFVPRDDEAHEQLHRLGAQYSSHEKWALQVREFFNQGDSKSIGKILKKISQKNRFIIRSIELDKSMRRIVEFGCSRGYLTAYFLAQSYDIFGVDVSTTAVDSAREMFGDKFVVAGDDRIRSGAPYDAIYHAGTIGCVESPLNFTFDLLDLLRPGGLLVFNSPDIMACLCLGIPWVPGTSPPDLVTLFRRQFWLEQFSEIADVRVTFEPPNSCRNLKTLIKQMRGIPLIPDPTEHLLKQRGENETDESALSSLRNLTARLAVGPLNILSRVRILPSYPTEGGMFVWMRKRP